MHRRLLCLGIVVLVAAFALNLGPRAYPAMAKEGSISGRLVNDLDADGDREDDSEPGLAGWRITLQKTDEQGEDAETWEARTDAHGAYVFHDLPPGEYELSIPCSRQPDLWVGTWPNESGIFIVTLDDDDIDVEDIDFLLEVAPTTQARSGSISGRLVLDENRNGVAESWESGIGGWQVEASLQGGECSPPEYSEVLAYSEADGSFHLPNLVPGRYNVGPIVPEGGGYLLDSPGITSQSPDYTSFQFLADVAVPANANSSVSIGVLSTKGTGSILGVIYYDLNRNGVRDPAEPLTVGNQWVGLVYRIPAGYTLVNCCLTFVGGSYQFSGLAAGDYLVGAISLLGHGVNPSGGNDGLPDFPVSLQEGEQRKGVDFGSDEQPPLPVLTETPQPIPTLTEMPQVAPTVEVTAAATGPMGAPNTGSGGASDVAGRGSVLAALLALGAAGALAAGSAFAARTRRR